MDPTSGVQNRSLPCRTHQQKQPFSTLPCLTPMDIRSLCKCNSGCSDGADGEAIHLSRSSRGGGSSTSSSVASVVPPPPSGPNHAKQRWRELWTKLKKEKSRVPTEGHVPYDFYNYSQNFDQGIAWDEAENLSRSFSVRFADPASKIYAKKRAVK
ncbi:uncharacterized protein LOC130136071 [Syzygium oleosum]|uniref:uncharacterized protein LOC130136071 n=1 Tax=Syzygium oleosum TaxID=219896 RepID=UPI0024BAFE4F|nr:uncharacterized protein LOC130136071 [Syzygium oleosum]